MMSANVKYVAGVGLFAYGMYLVVQNLLGVGRDGDPDDKNPGQQHFDTGQRQHPAEHAIISKDHPRSWDNTSRRDLCDKQTTYSDGRRFYS